MTVLPAVLSSTREAQNMNSGSVNGGSVSQPTHCRRIGDTGALCGALLIPQAGEALDDMRGRVEAPVRYLCTVGHSSYAVVDVPKSPELAARDEEIERLVTRHRQLRALRGSGQAPPPRRPSVKARRARKWPSERIEAFRVAWNHGDSALVLGRRFTMHTNTVSGMAAYFRRQGYDFARCLRGKGARHLCGWVRGGSGV